MYNRYIPSADGSYRRQTVPGEKQVSQPPKEPVPEPISPVPPHPAQPRGKNPFMDLHLDSGDLLVLLILLSLYMKESFS